MKSFVIFLVILIVLMFLSATCTNTTEQTNVGGVDIKFRANRPPAETKEYVAFPIEVLLSNNGDAPVDVDLCIRDLADDAYDGVSNDWSDCHDVNVEGLIKDQKESFGVYSYSNLDFDLTGITISARASYNYENSVNAKICVKGADIEESNCKETEIIRSSALVNNRPAPIAVDSIEKEILQLMDGGTMISLKITLKKVSDGELASDQLRIRVSLPNGETFDCSDIERGDNLAWKPQETEKIINCDTTLNVGDNTVYETGVTIDLDYDYSIIASTEIDVKNIDEEERERRVV